MFNPSAPAQSVTDEHRWLAVLARDYRADGLFWFGVVTTGIYCRPHCPSRRARRENVRFFASPAEARAAGLRPCRRCSPDAKAPPAVRREN